MERNTSTRDYGIPCSSCEYPIALFQPSFKPLSEAPLEEIDGAHYRILENKRAGNP